jgi:hypothetical protein
MSAGNTIRVRADEIRKGDIVGGNTVHMTETTTTITFLIDTGRSRLASDIIRTDPHQMFTVVRPNTAPLPR